MEIFTIYKNPLDYPDSFVLRRFKLNVPDTDPVLVCSTLTAARAAVPDDKTYFPRDKSDHYCVVESWI